MSDSKIEEAEAAQSKPQDDRSSLSDSEEEKDQVPQSIQVDQSRPSLSNQIQRGGVLNPQTQQIIMEIIQALRKNTSDQASEQLFKILTETSEAIEQGTEKTDREKEIEESIKKEAMPFEDQLKILLDKLNANIEKGPISQKRKFSPQNRDQTSEDASNLQEDSKSGTQQSQRITDAYRLINEVIMIPQIMWTRNFFYSLGAMSPSQQQIVNTWFQEMNEKQQIYIKEIERANDQLKQSSSDLFAQKGFGREQTDLFLKKVNFMENREYFFHKRKAMTKDGEKEFDENEEFSHPKVSFQYSEAKRPHMNSRRKLPSHQISEKDFYDNMGTSCNLSDGEINHRPIRQGQRNSKYQPYQQRTDFRNQRKTYNRE